MGERTPRFLIGQRFKTRGKHPRECTVIDILRTHNSAGELIRIAYVATHQLAGRTITDHNVCDATIAMGLVG